jgi:integrase
VAYVEIRVSGRPKATRGLENEAGNSKRPNRVRRTFRDTKEGRSGRDAFVCTLSEVVSKYDLRYKVDGRLVTETFDTKKDAEKRQTEVEAAQDTGYAIDPAGGRITVDQLADRWLASDPGKRGSTVGRDRSALHAHISPAIGSRQLDSIHQPDVQDLVNEWATSTRGKNKGALAPRTVKRTYGCLRAMFAYAVKARLIPRSPCHDVNLPRVARRDARIVTPEDAVTLAGAMDERYAPMVWIGALLGLRWGEVAGLRVGRLDLLARTLTVAEQVTRDEHGRPVTGPPKSDAGIRTLSIPDLLVETLAKHLAKSGLTGADADALLFPAPSGGPWAYGNYRRRIWQPATERGGLIGVGFHDLRRTAGTQLVLSNVDLKTIGTRLGHSDPRLTLAIYAQATSEADRAAADAIGERFAVTAALSKTGLRAAK